MNRTHKNRKFRSGDGTAAVEFAIIFPVLLILLLCGAQITLYVRATQKIQLIASSISEMISQAKPPTNSTTTASLSSMDLNFSYDSAQIIFPYIMKDAKRRGVAWRDALTVSFAGISFIKRSDSCGVDRSSCYTAVVNWTSLGTSTNSYRPCLVPQMPIDDSASYNRLNLPRSVYGPSSIVAVDVTYTFYPTFGSGLIGPVTITRSAFLHPRYATQIDFDASNNDGVASTCV